MIKYYLTAHAAQRLSQRSITKEEVEEALTAPDYTYPGRQGELNLVKVLGKGRRIRVVAKPKKDRMKVITAIVFD
jgi:hypothetical protein